MKPYIKPQANAEDKGGDNPALITKKVGGEIIEKESLVNPESTTKAVAGMVF